MKNTVVTVGRVSVDLYGLEAGASFANEQTFSKSVGGSPSNVAVAAAALADAGERVLIVDFDAHHGNGTQDIFYDDPRVMFVSLHQWPLYPGTGWYDETGVGEGVGYTMNIPLPPQTTGDVYLAAFDQLILPISEKFAPTWLIVSAGYDAHRNDPITQMGLSSGDYP